MNLTKNIVSAEEVCQDVNVILWSSRLCNIYRYTHQRFWEVETKELEYALRIEGVPRLESVAEHSWHLADIVLLIGHRFLPLDIGRCLSLTILHDKLEIITGDKHPQGRDGSGRKTYAFNNLERKKKDLLEREALHKYCKSLNDYAKQHQRKLIDEIINGKSREARFIKGLDKLQPLTFILRKKKGNMTDSHIQFTIRYSRTSLEYFPELEPYHKELSRRLLRTVAQHKGLALEEIEQIAFDDRQLELPPKLPFD